jgi:hypothetical protein
LLEQYLADLEARFVLLSEDQLTQNEVALTKVAEVIEGYRAYRSARAAGTRARLPEWNEAYQAERILNQLLTKSEAKAALARQLGILETVDPNAHSILSAQWEKVKDDSTMADEQTHELLAGALRATQWKNTQQWIIRRLAIRYASRLRAAFLIALGIGILLVLADAIYVPTMRSAALSGLGFAAAAGLMGAAFSAMVRQGQVLVLDNIEEANAATSKQIIALRLGVGCAAAIIVYFFFESGLVAGALFPDLEQIGFGRVIPLGTELDELRAAAQTLNQSAGTLMTAIATALDSVEAATALVATNPDLAGQLIEIKTTGAGAGAADASESAKVLAASLEGAATTLTQADVLLAEMTKSWELRHLPLGSLSPNADLSKLVVWCFAAGFTQTLVPSLLARVTLPEETRAAQASGGSTPQAR